jgi:transcriptional regulator with XRE-family HTH domain
MSKQRLLQAHFMITLRLARMSCGYSVAETSRLSGVSESTIRRAEKDCGKMYYTGFINLCKLYHVDPDYIFIGKEQDAWKRQRRLSEIVAEEEKKIAHEQYELVNTFRIEFNEKSKVEKRFIKMPDGSVKIKEVSNN